MFARSVTSRYAEFCLAVRARVEEPWAFRLQYQTLWKYWVCCTTQINTGYLKEHNISKGPDGTTQIVQSTINGTSRLFDVEVACWINKESSLRRGSLRHDVVSQAFKDQHLHVDQIDYVGMARCGSKDVCFRHGGLNGCNPEPLVHACRA